MKDTIVIFGSSRSCGNTWNAIQAVLNNREVRIVDLSKNNVLHYDYEYKNQTDDFLRIISLVLEYNNIIFATPVYWYSMSAQLKIFFDRLSDLIRIKKDFGRMLKGKKCYLISSGTDEELPIGFEIPFKNTCKYFNMIYEKSFYYRVPRDEIMPDSIKIAAEKFGNELFHRKIVTPQNICLPNSDMSELA